MGPKIFPVNWFFDSTGSVHTTFLFLLKELDEKTEAARFRPRLYGPSGTEKHKVE